MYRRDARLTFVPFASGISYRISRGVKPPNDEQKGELVPLCVAFATLLMPLLSQRELTMLEGRSYPAVGPPSIDSITCDCVTAANQVLNMVRVMLYVNCLCTYYM